MRDVLNKWIKSDRISMIASISIIAFCAGCIALLFRFRPILGDDVLTQFENGYGYYLDNKLSIGAQITSLPQIASNVMGNYMNWMSRCVGVLLIPFLSIFGVKSVAVMMGLLFAAFVYMVGLLIFKTWREVFRHPLALLLISLMLIYFSCAADFMLMWIMALLNILTAVLYLIYMHLEEKVVLHGDHPIKLWKLICFNLLGFITGLTHEMAGVMFLFMVGLQCLYYLVTRKASFVKLLLSNIGILAGFFFCVFAPGNFNRSRQQHSLRGFTEPYSERLANSYDQHITFAQGSADVSNAIIVTLLVLAVIGILYAILDKKIKPFLESNFHYMAGIVLSVFIWAIGPTVPYYSLFSWYAIVLILLFKSIRLIPRLEGVLKQFHLNSIVCVIVSVFIISSNAPWVRDLMQVTRVRERLIREAVALNLDEVEVPLYPESTNNLFTMHNYNNNPKEFATDYYQAYYEILVIPK